MAAVAEMATKRPVGRPKTSDRDDVTIRVNRAIAHKARVIAAQRQITIAELITEILQQPIDRAFASVVREIDRS
jgi:hypothetical protein